MIIEHEHRAVDDVVVDIDMEEEDEEVAPRHDWKKRMQGSFCCWFLSVILSLIGFPVTVYEIYLWIQEIMDGATN